MSIDVPPLEANPARVVVGARRFVSDYERELTRTLRVLWGYWYIYIPQDPELHAAVDPMRCRHEIQRKNDAARQCPRYRTEEIRGFWFCDYHAEIVYKYLDEYY